MRGITALEKLHERVGNAISRSHASDRFDNDSGLVFEWDVDIWNLADDGQDAPLAGQPRWLCYEGEKGGGTVIASTEP